MTPKEGLSSAPAFGLAGQIALPTSELLARIKRMTHDIRKKVNKNVTIVAIFCILIYAMIVIILLCS